MTVLKNINFKVSNSWIDAGSLTYPVGSVYSSTSSTSPATLFGGAWSKVTNRYLKSSSTLKVSSEGGSTSHNHNADSLCAAIGATGDLPHTLGYIVGSVNGPTSGSNYVAKGAGYSTNQGQRFNHYMKVYGETGETTTEPPYREWSICGIAQPKTLVGGAC